MPTCQICLGNYRSIRFHGKRIKICGRCANALNDKSGAEPAHFAESRLGNLLQKGMERNAYRDLESSEEWKRQKAHRTLGNIDAALANALPGWLNRLLAKPDNRSIDFKRVRAYRRGLLHYTKSRDLGYPPGWPEIAQRIRQLDDYHCQQCGSTDRVLDVHHIVYRSNFGTNRQENLITLCRPCHEAEHGRELGIEENHEHDVTPRENAGHLSKAREQQEAPAEPRDVPQTVEQVTRSTPPKVTQAPECSPQPPPRREPKASLQAPSDANAPLLHRSFACPSPSPEQRTPPPANALDCGFAWARYPMAFGLAVFCWGALQGDKTTAAQGILTGFILGAPVFAIGALVGYLRARRKSD